MDDLAIQATISTALAPVDNVGAVPSLKSQYDPNAAVREPVPSCVINMTPLCPAEILEGLAKVVLPVRVVEKLLAVLKSNVIVVP